MTNYFIHPAVLPDLLPPKPPALSLDSSPHNGQPGGGPDVLRVLLSVL